MDPQNRHRKDRQVNRHKNLSGYLLNIFHGTPLIVILWRFKDVRKINELNVKAVDSLLCDVHIYDILDIGILHLELETAYIMNYGGKLFEDKEKFIAILL